MVTKSWFSFRPYRLSPCQVIFCVASVLLFLKSICMWLSLTPAPSSAFLAFHKVTLISSDSTDVALWASRGFGQRQTLAVSAMLVSCPHYLLLFVITSFIWTSPAPDQIPAVHHRPSYWVSLSSMTPAHMPYVLQDKSPQNGNSVIAYPLSLPLDWKCITSFLLSTVPE